MKTLLEQLIEKGYLQKDTLKVNSYKMRQFLREKELLNSIHYQFNSTSPQEALYLISKQLTEPPKCECGRVLKFKTFSQGYASFCSAKCNNTSDEGRRRKKEALQAKYGVDHYSSTQEYKDKFKKTINRKYGVDNPNQTEFVKQKKRETTLKNYGVENPSQAKEVIEKKQKTRWLTTFQKLQNLQFSQMVQPLFTEQDYKGIDRKYTWKCVLCNTVFKDHLKYGKVPTCPKCFSSSMPVSKIEKEISQWVKSLGVQVIENTKAVIAPKELDIYIPLRGIAIELNGIYRHSEVSGSKESNYHLNKTKMCEEKGIRLFHIFDDEWVLKREIVQSILSTALGIIQHKYAARKCIMRDVSISDAKVFYDNNHIQGFSSAKIHLGLYYNNTLVQMSSFKRSRFSNQYDWELIRSATLLNTQVTGGFSKLLSRFTKQYPGSIVTYADKRLFTGASYLKVGFVLRNSSPPSYFYTKNHFNRLNRLQFQKHLLEKTLPTFDPNLTEWENMQLNGYDRIWDCGTLVYEYKNTN